MSKCYHSNEFITDIFKLSREIGLSARSIAEIMSPKYKSYRGVAMSRNAVISILYRYRDSFTHLGKKQVKRVNFSDIAENLESARQEMKNKNEYKVKKCLCCRKEKLLHRVSFVCDTCKTSAAYSSCVEDYSVGY